MIHKYVNYLKEYVVDHFDWKLYSAFLVLISALLYFNYGDGREFEDTVLDSYYGEPIQFFYYLLFQGIPYYLAVCLVMVFKPQNEFWLNKWFWLYSLLGISIIAFDRSFYLHHELLSGLKYNTRMFSLKIASNSREIFTMLSPLLLFYFLYDKKSLSHFYGLRLKGVSFTPYVLMLLIMSVLVFCASFSEDFQSHYPVYNVSYGERFAKAFEINKRIPFVLFEVVYATSFVMVELIFRGFLIIGLVRFLGDDVVLPMAVTYCVLHFGKPLGESISSVFGAYILGVIALRSKNIWGGVFVHAGIAIMMDLVAYYT